ncbi:MAG TPA: FKBP-type peptidyl-prolyl cis-trans isomerase [Gemmatimonas sp.]|nr:FKBP-type peptidyl-prolyl cis-trans isomerase [Gemmatimonas sp.]
MQLPSFLPLMLLPILAAACGPSAQDRADSAIAAAAAERAEDEAVKARAAVVDTVFAPSLGVDLATMTRTASGMYVRELAAGRGKAADSTSTVLVRYWTRVPDGTTLDSTAADMPLRVQLGQNQLLLAWEEGIRGMRAGGRRLIVAPPALGYGAAGKPGRVPSMSTLVFDIELLKVIDSP